jgi:two-component system sensor histidine kinase KdpD
VIGSSSEQESLYEELAAMRRQATELQCEAAALSARLQRELDEREELLTIVSHELRTPVTVISGYNRLLLSDQVGSLNSEQRRFLEESSKSCQRLDRFIGNLLQSSRAGAGAEPLDLRRHALCELVEGVVKFLRPLLDEHELEVEVAMDPTAVEGRFDSSRIEQVLTNLLGNAIKYTQPGSAVLVESRALECQGRACVEVSVLDDGPGIAAEDRERIFDPYVRASEESRASGLGLGLAICRRIIEAHGGSIGVDDRKGGGSRFHFTLPAERSAAWSAER